MATAALTTPRKYPTQRGDAYNVCVCVRARVQATTAYRLTFIEEGEEIEVEFEAGSTILDVALDNDIEIEGSQAPVPLAVALFSCGG